MSHSMSTKPSLGNVPTSPHTEFRFINFWQYIDRHLSLFVRYLKEAVLIVLIQAHMKSCKVSDMNLSCSYNMRFTTIPWGCPIFSTELYWTYVFKLFQSLYLFVRFKVLGHCSFCSAHNVESAGSRLISDDYCVESSSLTISLCLRFKFYWLRT